MALLGQPDHEDIRKAIDTDLTADDVPDDVIARSVYRGRGEAEVLRRVPDAESLAGEDLAAAKLGAVLFTAALLAEGLPRLTQERIGNYSYSLARNSADVAGIAANLRRGAEAALAPILPEPATARRRFAGGFVVARAAR
jgi:hypothetical protein